MAVMVDLIQSTNHKVEKHTPEIECPDRVKKGETVKVTVNVGKEFDHPNTPDHHISWIDLYFLPDNEKFPYQIGYNQFSAHGESRQGLETSGIYTHHECTLSFKTEKSGILIASSFCNVHGLWHNEKKINII
jgi:superoxide reductase